MKLLVDANLSYRVAAIIREAGYESSQAVDHNLKQGVVVSLSVNHLRIRRLPLG